MTQEKILVSLIHFLNEGSKDKRAIESFLGRGDNIDHYLDELKVLGIYPQIKNDIYSIEKIELLDKSLIAEILNPLENSFQIQLMIEDIIETTSKAFSPSEIFNNRVKICLAEFQTQGRGRGKREWLSPFSSGICCSVYTQLHIKSAPLGLSVFMGVQLVNLLESIGFIGLKLKWPNDIFFNEQKLGGILIELSQNKNSELIVNFGFGINYALPNEFRNLNVTNNKPIDLKSVKNGNLLSRNEITGYILKTIILSIHEFTPDSVKEIRDHWNELDYFHDQNISVESDNEIIHGYNRGIDIDGSLLIEQGSNLRKIISGHIVH